MARELNDADLDAIYRRVEQRAIETTQRQEQPVAILLGGQPGSARRASPAWHNANCAIAAAPS